MAGRGKLLAKTFRSATLLVQTMTSMFVAKQGWQLGVYLSIETMLARDGL
jgi:hypothetical protein